MENEQREKFKITPRVDDLKTVITTKGNKKEVNLRGNDS